MFGMELAGGAFIFLAFVVLYLVAVVYSTYTRRGSAIAQRPHNRLYTGAPGAGRRGTLGSDRDRAAADWSRGCR